MAKFNVTSTEEATQIIGISDTVSPDDFISVEVDGTELTEIAKVYTFNTLGEHTIKYDLKDKTKISVGMYYSCKNLIEVSIPNSVASIGGGAFNTTGITNIEIPNSVEHIEGGVFGKCDNLVSLTIPVNVTSMGTGIIDDCINFKQLIFNASCPVPANFCTSTKNIEEVAIGDKVDAIGEGAFAGCTSLSHVVIGSNVKFINSGAFSGCSSLTSITIPSSVTNVGNAAFGSCGLTEIELPSSINSIGNFIVINNFNLKRVIFNASCDIPEGCFNNLSSIEFVTIGDNVTGIGNGAFSNCFSLTSITIPDSVTGIGAGAFISCNNLSYVKIESTTPPHLGAYSGEYNAFKNNAPGRKIYVPAESLETYKAAEGWSTYASDIYPIE